MWRKTTKKVKNHYAQRGLVHQNPKNLRRQNDKDDPDYEDNEENEENQLTPPSNQGALARKPNSEFRSLLGSSIEDEENN